MPIQQDVLDAINTLVFTDVLGEEMPDEGDGYRNWPVLQPDLLPRERSLKILRVSFSLYGRIHLPDVPDDQLSP